jgi:hypothetical protein
MVVKMINQPTIYGIYIGLGFGVLYLLMHLYIRQPPDFKKFATIVLSCVGAVVGIAFGFVALTAPDSNLGVLTDQRLPMVLGAGAVIWLAVEQALNIYHPIFARCVQKYRPNNAINTDN